MTLFDHDLDDIGAEPSHVPMRQVPRRDWRKDWLRKILNTSGATLLWTVPGLELSLGQSRYFFILKSGYVLSFELLVLVITGYLITVILCMVLQAPLTENPNRAGN
jgi:hypothetical protein